MRISAYSSLKIERLQFKEAGCVGVRVVGNPFCFSVGYIAFLILPFQTFKHNVSVWLNDDRERERLDDSQQSVIHVAIWDKERNRTFPLKQFAMKKSFLCISSFRNIPYSSFRQESRHFKRAISSSHDKNARTLNCRPIMLTVETDVSTVYH